MESKTEIESPHRLSRAQFLAVIIAFVAAVLPAILWPGDTPWVYDEPAEVNLALSANQEHRLAHHALSGNFWVWYGPLPIQIMQLFLLFTHDPRALVVLRGALYGSITAGSMLWLGRTLRLNLWFVAGIMLAPHLWLWNRQLWAAYLAVPFSALAVAAYASFLFTGRGAALATAIGAAISLPLIHPQALPVSIVIFSHLLWRNTPALIKHKWPVLAVICVLAVLNARYIVYATGAVYRQVGTSVKQGHPTQIPRIHAALGALMGGRLMSVDDFNEAPILLHRSALVTLCKSLGLAAIPLVWFGVLIACRQLLIRRSSARSEQDAVLNTMLRLALAGTVVQAVLFAVLRVPPKPYYLFGVFGFNVCFAWVGAEALYRARLGAIFLTLCSAALMVFSLGTQWLVHRDGWPLHQISPTLNEQIAIAQSLNRYTDRSAWTNVSTYRDHDSVNALWALRKLYPPSIDQAQRESGRLFIRYAAGADGQPTGRIEIVEISNETDLPTDAKKIELQFPDE